VDAQTVGYAVVHRVLEDTSFLRDFTGMNTLIRSEFIRVIGENLVFLTPTRASPDNGTPRSSGVSPATWKIAVATAFISFAVTIILMYGLYRQRKAIMGKAAVKSRLAHYQAKRRSFWAALQQENADLEPGWMTTESAQIPLPEPSITFSFSDITSDSQSIRSSLPMDKIAEEGPSDECDEEVATNPSNSPPSSPSNIDLHDSLFAEEFFQFTAVWDDPDLATKDTASDCASYDHQTLPYFATDPDGVTAEACESEGDVTPVRRNYGLEDYDATTSMSEQGELCGFRYLDDSTDDELSSAATSSDNDKALDEYNDTNPTDDEETPAILMGMQVEPAICDRMSLSDDESHEEDSPSPTVSVESDTGDGLACQNEGECAVSSELIGSRLEAENKLLYRFINSIDSDEEDAHHEGHDSFRSCRSSSSSGSVSIEDVGYGSDTTGGEDVESISTEGDDNNTQGRTGGDVDGDDAAQAFENPTASADAPLVESSSSLVPVTDTVFLEGESNAVAETPEDSSADASATNEDDEERDEQQQGYPFVRGDEKIQGGRSPLKESRESGNNVVSTEQQGKENHGSRKTGHRENIENAQQGVLEGSSSVVVDDAMVKAAETAARTAVDAVRSAVVENEEEEDDVADTDGGLRRWVEDVLKQLVESQTVKRIDT